MDFPVIVSWIGPITIKLIVWVIAFSLALAIISTRSGGLEKFLLIGASLMAVSSLLLWLESGYRLLEAMDLETAELPEIIEKTKSHEVSTGDRIIVNFGRVGRFLPIAGFIFIAYAFWQKFKTGILRKSSKS